MTYTQTRTLYWPVTLWIGLVGVVALSLGLAGVSFPAFGLPQWFWYIQATASLGSFIERAQT